MDFIAVNNFGDTRSGGLAGPMGLFVILLLALATVLLIRNMNKRLRRLPDSFEQPKTTGGDAGTTVRDDAHGRADSVADRDGIEGDRSGSSTPVAEAQVSESPSAKSRTEGNG